MRDAALQAGDEVLVVGGTGLIGRALARALPEVGLQPLLVARHDPPTGLLAAPTRCLRLERNELPALLRSGLLPGGHGRALGVVDVLAGSAGETAPLLDALAQRPGRFIAIGSAAVFGLARSGLRHDEASAPQPGTEAMRRKVDVEQLVARRRAAGVAGCVLRIAYPYGPGHGPLGPLGRARDLFERLQGGGVIDWVAPGVFSPLQPLAVDDLARVIAALLTRRAALPALLHVAGPQTLDWSAYLEVLARGRPLGRRLRLHDADRLCALQPAARWVIDHLRQAPLLDDAMLQAMGLACRTPLAAAVDDWAAWCLSGLP
ncbi:MAG: hypothetical protein AMXMBFR66_15230 [Pseudomonadota bacterium]|nr:hypothetical protein [Rubrivivax sp.]